MDRYDTRLPLVRRVVKDINQLVTGTADTPIWTPHENETLILTQAFVRCVTSTGTNTDTAEFELEVSNVDTVASVSAPIIAGAVNRLTVIGNTPFTAANPLTITVTDAAGGSTVLTMDLILVALRLEDL